MKWKGYKEHTWEAEENMEGAGRALELFWDRKEKEDEVKRIRIGPLLGDHQDTETENK